MDQIVFVFDLEHIVGWQEDKLIEATLNNVTLAALRIATFCSDAGTVPPTPTHTHTPPGKIAESRRDLKMPSLGFRLKIFLV